MTGALDWPTHPDGRAKKIGEMLDTERTQVFARLAKRIKAEMEAPAVQEALADFLAGAPTGDPL